MLFENKAHFIAYFLGNFSATNYQNRLRYSVHSLSLYRRSQFENALLVQSWRIHFEDIEMVSSKGKHKDANVDNKSILFSYLFFSVVS